VRYVTVGGLEVSELFLGCGNFGGIGSPPEFYGKGDNQKSAFTLMDAALAAGITMFDTANTYAGGVSEDWIGQWLTSRGTRDDVYLTTKVSGPVGPGPQDQGLSRKHIRTQVEASLNRLRTDRIDLYLAHAPDEATPITETVAAFDELVREGKIRNYGLSNYSVGQLEAALTAMARPANLQCGYNLLDRSQSTVFETCRRAGVAFTAYSPLAGGLLTGKYRGDQPPPPGTRMALRPTPLPHLTHDALYKALGELGVVADRYGVPLATLSLAWLRADPNVTALVVGPRTPAQLSTMCDAVDLDLTEDECAELTAIVANA
jgi:aryl-alcohol dehydrogenase-like predicted oxidoreductase